MDCNFSKLSKSVFFGNKVKNAFTRPFTCVRYLLKVLFNLQKATLPDFVGFNKAKGNAKVAGDFVMKLFGEFISHFKISDLATSRPVNLRRP